ncbi:MAG: hypothetical protein WCK42_03890 [Myxococcaceae bacterium]
MKIVLFLLVLISGLQVLAEDKSNLMSKMASSSALIAAGCMMPSLTYSQGKAKFAFYFSAGSEHPCWVMPVVGLVGVCGSDPVAVSVTFSLANRCMALTGLHEQLGISKGLAYTYVAAADLFLGNIPGLERFAQTKWMGASGNALEHTLGALPAGLAMMAIALSGNFDEIPSNEFSEESGMRLRAALGTSDVIENSVLALTSFQAAKWLAPWNKVSKWFAAAGMHFMINALVLISKEMQQKLNA